MPITSTNPFKGRHFPGEVILPCVRWSNGQNTRTARESEICDDEQFA
jgi:hypothetical protein